VNVIRERSRSTHRSSLIMSVDRSNRATLLRVGVRATIAGGNVKSRCGGSISTSLYSPVDPRIRQAFRMLEFVDIASHRKGVSEAAFLVLLMFEGSDLVLLFFSHFLDGPIPACCCCLLGDYILPATKSVCGMVHRTCRPGRSNLLWICIRLVDLGGDWAEVVIAPS